MKRLISLSVLLLISSCGIKTNRSTTLSAGKSTMQLYEHAMAVQSTCSSFTHIATLNSSLLNGNKLQATGLAKKDNLVFIAYNTQYDAIRGGLDVVSLNSNNQPTLIASLISANSEYADLKIIGNNLFMVGQKKGDTQNYAVLTVVDITTPTLPKIISELTFAGYYATSIDIQNNKAYIAVPNLGVKIVDISNPLSLTDLGVESNTNILFAKRKLNTTLSVGGASNFQLFKKDSLAQTSLSVLSSSPQEAPSRFITRGDLVISNGGFSGLNIIDQVLGTPAVKNKSSLTGTGNGLANGTCNKVFLAQGETGLQVLDITSTTAPLNEGSFDYADDSGSANNVFFVKDTTGNYVFIADGLAGVKIVKVNNSCACADLNNGNDAAIFDDAHDGMLCYAYDLSKMNPTPSKLPDFSTMTPVGSFKASKMDVIPQDYANSFPYFPTALKSMTEWYGVKCEGIFVNKQYNGSTALGISADDGANLYVDDVKLVDNDGLHSAVLKTSNFNFVLNKEYKIKFEYFQGPKTGINMELKAKSSTDTDYSYLTNFYH